MADVTLEFGGRQHVISCRDGSEDQVRRTGAMLQQRWAAAAQASGGLNSERTMLYVALMLADALDEAQRGLAPSPAVAPSPADAAIAERLEAIALTLEQALARP